MQASKAGWEDEGLGPWLTPVRGCQEAPEQGRSWS